MASCIVRLVSPGHKDMYALFDPKVNKKQFLTFSDESIPHIALKERLMITGARTVVTHTIDSKDNLISDFSGSFRSFNKQKERREKIEEYLKRFALEKGKLQETIQGCGRLSLYKAEGEIYNLKCQITRYQQIDTIECLDCNNSIGAVLKVACLIRDFYVDIEIGNRCYADIINFLEDGRFKDMSNFCELAKFLESFLCEATQDGHIRIMFCNGPQPPMALDCPATWLPCAPVTSEYSSCFKCVIKDLGKCEMFKHFTYQGFKIEHFGKDISYIRMDDFKYYNNEDKFKQYCCEIHDVFMDFKGSGCKALILDFRLNTGGSLDTMKTFCGFFLPDRTTLDTYKRRIGDYYREENPTVSPVVVYGEEVKFDLNIPIIILNSGQTASAAEGFTSNIMQLRKKVIIVGQRTAGLSNVGSTCYINKFLKIFIPYMFVDQIIFGGNWEIEGIPPDIHVEENASHDRFLKCGILAAHGVINEEVAV